MSTVEMIMNTTLSETPTNMTLSETSKFAIEAESQLGLVTGLLVASLMILVGIVIVTVCLATVFVKKRKAITRSLQLEVLTRWADNYSDYRRQMLHVRTSTNAVTAPRRYTLESSEH